MGTYNYSTKEIIDIVADALDSVEGNFTQRQLFSALKKLRQYPYVCDKNIDDTKWDNFINKQEAKR